MENGIDGLLVPFGNVEALTLALEQLIHDRELRNKLGDTAVENARKRFSVNSIIPKYENLYNKLCKLPAGH